MENTELRRKRDSAVAIQFDVEPDDRIVELIPRASGLYAVTHKKIFKLQTPDQLDPDMEHPDTPWEQSVYLPHGSSDPLVARTILQTKQLGECFFGGKPDTRESMMDVSWEVLSSLVSIRMTKEKLEERVSEIVATINSDIDAYTKGTSPKPLPTIDYFEIQFRSFVNEVRRVLSTISDLFLPLAAMDFSKGHFHKALEWSRKERGEDNLLTKILTGDQTWIATWIDMRNAIEHPRKNRYVETLNTALEPDRRVRLPTWRFVHPDYDMGRPQNLLDVFGICIDNLLKFYEDIQVALVDGHLPSTVKVRIAFIDEENRDPSCPMRMNFGPGI